MSEVDERPNPDLLLRRVQKEEACSKRGKLKLFFGFAPGVGKTYRMLQVARDLVTDQGVDVVVGLVEDHRRVETARMVLGLELLPRRKIEYHGKVLEEFDLDTALARKPALLLVDELAHSNPADSRHTKRWQDVEELLDAGIDVFSTMNVQHVESLNDIVAQITGIRVRETVPDSVLDHADAVELVDIAPEELLARLAEGKVYLPDQARRAADHFFQRGNLLSLRELALRRTAQHVDEDVQEYREAHGVQVAWPAGERILVCIGPAESSGRLIRTAARMAAGLRCPWVASSVESIAAPPMSKANRNQLEAHLRLAESLGATVATLSGPSIAGPLLEYARKHNVTRLIIGKPTHSRLRDRVRGSLLDEIVRGSGGIDVQVISGDAPRSSASPHKHEAEQKPRRRNYLSALALVGATLGLSLGLRELLDLPDLEMLFLLTVMIAAVRFGRGPSIFAAALGVVCYDVFFVPPFHTLSVEDRRYFLTFGMMFVVGFVMSELAGRLRRQQRDARAREERTAVLYGLTRELSSADEPTQIATIAAQHAASVFSTTATILFARSEVELCPIGAAPEGSELDIKEMSLAKWSYEHDALAGHGTDTLPGSKALASPLRTGASRLGVLVLRSREETAPTADQRAFLDVFCRQVAVALERVRLSDEARQSALRAETEEVRSSLLQAVSHDLRTPLASITGSATSLRDDSNLSQGTRRELTESIVDEAERLERLVANLLDMTRLESGGLSLRRDWVPLDEMIGSALTRLEKRLGNRPLTVSIAEEVPPVFVDPVLFEQVFVNLLENAEKYTPPESPIEIEARLSGDRVEIDLMDHGEGLPPGTETQAFEKFYRGPHRGIPGAGLGLSICKGIVLAHGGTIRAETRSTGGAAFHISIPPGSPPPTVEPAEGPA